MEKTTTSIMRKVLLRAAIMCLLLTFLYACDRQDAPSVDEAVTTSVESDASAATHDGADTETSTPADGEIDVTETTADTYIFYTDPVDATEFDKVFTAELSVDGEVIQTLTYSVKSYVYAKQNGENAEMAALARALYAYGRSAIAYKQEQ